MKKLLMSNLICLSICGAMAQTKLFTNKNGVAIKGYDPVAYFHQQNAVEGKDSFSFNWGGGKWKFFSQNNLDSFIAAPEKYAPQYGGFCAYGTSENHLSPTDPTAWTIVNNKLYLNYNMEVKKLWVMDTVSRIKAANSYWSLLNK